MSRPVALSIAVLAALAVVLPMILGGPDPRVAEIDARALFGDDLLDTTASYAAVKYGFWAVATLLRWATLAGLVVLGGGYAFVHVASRISTRPVVVTFLTMALLLTTLTLVALPLSYASGFQIEQAFGMSTQSRGAWFLDLLRSRAFWIAIYGFGAVGFLACLRRWQRRGWAVAAGGVAVVAVIGTAAAPLIIDPLFHDFTPLADRELEAEIVAIGERAGIDIQQVLVMDASRRTRRLNAYVTGLGATRRVVLYDNLVAAAPREELLLVVAHEIGHQRAGHVRIGLLWTVPALILATWALAWLAGWQARRDPQLEGPGDPRGLPLLWLALSVGLFLASPASSTISRSMEADADWVSLELTRDPDTFIAAKSRLAETNLSWVDPPGWVVRWFYSHPPLRERLGMAEYWRERSAD